MVRYLAMVTAAMLTFSKVAAITPAQGLPAPVLVDRASRYVAAYEAAFEGLFADEFQVQRLVGANGRVRQTRELRSDFIIVRTASGLLAFRDVVSIDRKPIRPRTDRLRRLFIDAPRSAPEQAAEIAKESAAHNIGPERSGYSPLQPLAFLRPGTSSGFRFTAKGPSLMFQELRTPSVLVQRTGTTRFNLMSKGTFTVDPESGRILSASYTAEGPAAALAVAVTVRYGIDKALGILVPLDVRERYYRPGAPKDDRVEVHSTFTNFRRFEPGSRP